MYIVNNFRICTLLQIMMSTPWIIFVIIFTILDNTKLYIQQMCVCTILCLLHNGIFVIKNITCYLCIESVLSLLCSFSSCCHAFMICKTTWNLTLWHTSCFFTLSWVGVYNRILDSWLNGCPAMDIYPTMLYNDVSSDKSYLTIV